MKNKWNTDDADGTDQNKDLEQEKNSPQIAQMTGMRTNGTLMTQMERIRTWIRTGKE